MARRLRSRDSVFAEALTWPVRVGEIGQMIVDNRGANRDISSQGSRTG